MRSERALKVGLLALGADLPAGPASHLPHSEKDPARRKTTMAPMLSQYLMAGPGLYRGPQPGIEHLLGLQEQGLRTVVNLRQESDESRYYCNHLGLAYCAIPVTDWTVPEVDQVEHFLDLMEHSPNRPLLVHCWGGVGRTGLFVSCWRIRMGMKPEEALRLSDMETPKIGMNQEQRDWVRAFRPRPRC